MVRTPFRDPERRGPGGRPGGGTPSSRTGRLGRGGTIAEVRRTVNVRPGGRSSFSHATSSTRTSARAARLPLQMSVSSRGNEPGATSSRWSLDAAEDRSDPVARPVRIPVQVVPRSEFGGAVVEWSLSPTVRRCVVAGTGVGSTARATYPTHPHLAAWPTPFGKVRSAIHELAVSRDHRISLVRPDWRSGGHSGEQPVQPP